MTLNSKLYPLGRITRCQFCNFFLKKRIEFIHILFHPLSYTCECLNHITSTRARGICKYEILYIRTIVPFEYFEIMNTLRLLQSSYECISFRTNARDHMQDFFIPFYRSHYWRRVLKMFNVVIYSAKIRVSNGRIKRLRKEKYDLYIVFSSIYENDQFSINVPR